MAEKESGKEIERVYVVPLRRAAVRSSKAAPRAIRDIRQFLTKHMKVKADDVWIDDSINKAIWEHGKFRIPHKIRVHAVKFDDGVVEASLPELGYKKSRREILREEREKKEPILKREEEGEKAAPVEGAPGAEGYEIAPTGEGEVKIKKKPAEKKKQKETKKEKTPTKKKKAPAKETKEEEQTTKEEKPVKSKKPSKSPATKKSSPKKIEEKSE